MGNGRVEPSVDAVAERLELILRELELAEPGMSQAEMGRRIGVDAQKLNNWFKARHLVSVDSALEIERVFGYRARWLVYGEHPERTLPPRIMRLAELLVNVPEGSLHIIEDMASALARTNEKVAEPARPTATSAAR